MNLQVLVHQIAGVAVKCAHLLLVLRVMNALGVINILRDDIINSESWLSDDGANPMALSRISSRVQSYAQQLKELEIERIKDLQNNGPTIFFNDLHTEVCVTLLREGKEKHILFCEHEISVVYTEMSDVIEEFNFVQIPKTLEGDRTEFGFLKRKLSSCSCFYRSKSLASCSCFYRSTNENECVENISHMSQKLL
jgi:hypothetical protein